MSRTTFDDLPATLAPTSPPRPPRRRRHWAKRLERCCCGTFAYLPLVFVYGLTTWAVWVEVNISFYGTAVAGLAGAGLWNWVRAVLGIALWTALNASYSIAVFTSPGSPIDERADVGRRRRGYEGLPTYEDDETPNEGREGESAARNMTMLTAKSTGKPRYCKKCATLKPDRAHHCSTCGRCVLKMDHHCPWLATCVGLRNYKPFLLFLIYTSLFCWLCFGVSASWVWTEIVDDVQTEEGLKLVNSILLAVLGGIIGLVLSGFTGWHLYLAITGQTTIESLEKTRYLSPLRKSMETQTNGRNYFDRAAQDGEVGITGQLKEMHANALPGVLRPEEGEDSGDQSRSPSPTPLSGSSPAKTSLQRNYASLEEQREQERYSAYLDELDSEKMPNAFDLGWKQNLLHIFGHTPLLWPVPVCNTTGDGWQWPINPKWEDARADLARQREARQREEEGWNGQRGDTALPPPPRSDHRWSAGQGFVNQSRPPPGRWQVPGKPDLQLQSLDRRKQSESSEPESYDTSSDEEVKRMYAHPQIQGTRNWNDVPEDFLSLGRKKSRSRNRSPGRRKGD